MKKFLISLAAFLCLAMSAKAEVIVDKIQTFDGYDKYPFYVMGFEPEIVDGNLSAPSPGGWYQYFVTDGFSLPAGKYYTITTRIRGSKAGEMNASFGNWGERKNITIKFTEEWSEISLMYTPLESEANHLCYQGTYDGTVEIEWIKISHSDPFATEVVKAQYYDSYEDGTFPFYHGEWEVPTIQDGMIVLDNVEPKEANWQGQFFVMDGVNFVQGETYLLTAKIRGTEPGELYANAGNWSAGTGMNLSYTTEWSEVTVVLNNVPVDNGFVNFQAGACKGKIEIEWVKLLREADPVEDTSVETIIKYRDYSADDSYPFYRMWDVPQVENGILVVDNVEPLDANWQGQYFVMDGINFTVGASYYFTAKIKGSYTGSLQVNVGNWDATVGASLSYTKEWSEVTVLIKEVPVESGFVVFQSGTCKGKLEIEWVKLVERIEVPEEATNVAEYFTGSSNSGTFGGWGATFDTSAVEDGKPCLKFTNEESKDVNAAQMAIFYEFNAGDMYYISFDIKGDAAASIESGFQAERDYAGCGSMTSFEITPEWKHVIIYGTPYDAGLGAKKVRALADGDDVENPETPVSNPPAKWIANLGKYVGSFYMTNVKLHKKDQTTGVSNVAAPAVVRTGVYNLMGVKVLDNADPAELRNLPKGIYIVNGKKMAL